VVGLASNQRFGAIICDLRMDFVLDFGHFPPHSLLESDVVDTSCVLDLGHGLPVQLPRVREPLVLLLGIPPAPAAPVHRRLEPRMIPVEERKETDDQSVRFSFGVVFSHLLPASSAISLVFELLSSKERWRERVCVCVCEIKRSDLPKKITARSHEIKRFRLKEWNPHTRRPLPRAAPRSDSGAWCACPLRSSPRIPLGPADFS